MNWRGGPNNVWAMYSKTLMFGDYIKKPLFWQEFKAESRIFGWQFAVISA